MLVAWADRVVLVLDQAIFLDGQRLSHYRWSNTSCLTGSEVRQRALGNAGTADLSDELGCARQKNRNQDEQG
jgi:hypothetical protein